MAVRKVLGQADSTRSGFCPSSGSEQLFKENLAAFPPSLHSPCASPAQCQGAPKYLLFFRILIFETAFLFLKLSSASSCTDSRKWSIWEWFNTFVLSEQLNEGE